MALVIVLLIFDWRIGLVAVAGVLLYLTAAELALRKSAAQSSVRQHTQESLVESVLEYIQGMGIVKSFRVGTGQHTIHWQCYSGKLPG